MKFYVLGTTSVKNLTVGNGKVLVLTDNVVYVYILNGRYERIFGRGIICCGEGIAIGPEGQIFVLDSVLKGCIIFNEDGVKKHEFTVRVGNDQVLHGLALHPLGEYVFVVGGC